MKNWFNGHETWQISIHFFFIRGRFFKLSLSVSVRFRLNFFLKGKGSVLRLKKSIPKFGSLSSPERQPKKPQRVTSFKRIMRWVSFSTIIVCIIKNEGHKFVF